MPISEKWNTEALSLYYYAKHYADRPYSLQDKEFVQRLRSEAEWLLDNVQDVIDPGAIDALKHVLSILESKEVK